ncbi:MAG: response regulator [Candidatus Hydrogenedentes bacterium]|nr:response regulator [Candidatus Hydrogenedentota bacterium]
MAAHTVLLVDDEINILQSLRRALRKEPYEVLVASSGQEGLVVLDSRRVDLVVSDQHMPGMSGTEFLSHVHRRFPDTVRFMLTGHATLEVAIEAINTGAISRFFTKPCNEVDLMASIRQALQQKDLMTEAWRLLRKVRHQSAVVKTLERDNPGITQVSRDHSGAIVVEETPGDFNELIQEIRKELSNEQ